MEKFNVVKDIVKHVKRFNLTGRTLEFKIRPIPVSEEPTDWVKSAVNQIIEKATEDVRVGDLVGFTFCSKDFKRGEGWIRFRPAEEITYDSVWEMISSVYQSNSSGLNTSTFCLSVTIVRMPAGRGRGRRYNTYEEECGMRRGIVTINNEDNMCLPRALIVAMAHANKDPMWNKVRHNVGKLQTQRALSLVQKAEVVIPEEGCGIPELEKFQRYLDNYTIVVYAYGNKGRDVIFKGRNKAPKLNLIYHKGHYNVVVSLTSAFVCSYYCEECHVPYNNKNDHRCGGSCPACLQSPPCSRDQGKINCNDCNRSFRGQGCFDKHKKSGSLGKSTVCAQITRCDSCLKTLKSGRQHICNEVYCKVCQNHVPFDHLCFIQPDLGTPKTEDILFIFYDLETRQEKLLNNGNYLHEPNLCVFKQCCSDCMNTTKQICTRCGMRLQIVKSRDVISPFTHHLLTIRKKFKQVVVIAHNGQAFDHQFILNHILVNTDLKPELIMRGTKIISMKIGNVKFLDSLNYFPMALAKLPKAFGLGDTFKKGYFPHLFNTEKNSDYVGPLPPTEFYSPDSMKDEERASFLRWYEAHKHDEFNMHRDLVLYCESDVKILTAACLKFREQLLNTGNVCPFSEASTIASACNKVYRRNFLQPNTIGIIPKGGYRWRDNQSKIAIQWLTVVEHTRKINILHAAKGKEFLLYGVKVDGYCPDTKEVFEFHGCYFHGCEKCFRYGRDVPLHDNLDDTMNSRRKCTSDKKERLKGFGYTVTEMWECEFQIMLKENADLKTFMGDHELFNILPLDPRDCFYGGRTGNTVEYYKCKPGEKIKYVDVCSLYPWVCKRGKFPLGHPVVAVGKQCDQVNLAQTDGVIKCKILPPRDLYHPVLPAKMNDKLMFVLCRTCGETMNHEECTHNEEQRALTGTWVIDEVNKSLRLGYEIMKIYEIWSYQVDQFNPTTRVGGLFTTMMNKFLQIKQQSSGWPNNCSTQEQREHYINQFLEREDIQLEFSEIIENPGSRSLAKLILNSFWGKLGQRENQPKTKIVRDPCEFFAMLVDPGIYVNAALPVNENTLVVNYEYRDEAYDVLSTVNVVIAAYVTTQARLKLYSYLECLGNRVLYYDTDSVIYVSRSDDEYEPHTGPFIGDMTNELDMYGKDSFITEFVSGGPKNYTYKVFSTRDNEEKVVCKVKGISLNYEASQVVNFDSIRDMVLSPTDPLPIISKNIRRTAEHEVVTTTQTKLYKPNSLKRKFLQDHSSTPYGYKK